MTRSRLHPFFGLFLLIAGSRAALAADPPVAPATAPPASAAPVAPTPATPVAPVVEIPDYVGAVWEPASPKNFKPSNRPSPEQAIDRIVIHDIEGSAMSAVRWFQNDVAEVSSHYVVDGKTGCVYQMVKERDIAWHAGDRITNARAVGIEHEGFGYKPGYFNGVEYEASARLVRDIALRYNIPRDRAHIIGHFEVPDSANPGKFGGRGGHTDPGPYWDWDYLMALIRNAATQSSGYLSGITLHPGETRDLAFALTNTGDDVWLADLKAAEDARLRTIGPVYLGAYATGGAAWGPESAFYGEGWVSTRFVASSATGDVPPGASGTFSVPLHTPLDVLGNVTETFRLYKVPPAPHLPVPFGPTISVAVSIEPWEVVVPLPPAPPAGWNAKTLPDSAGTPDRGARVFWHKGGKAGGVGTTANATRWQTDLPQPGLWDVYARYPQGKGRTQGATYRITTATDGVRTRTLDQRGSGGRWQFLGRYRFAVAPRSAEPGVRPGNVLPKVPMAQGVVELIPGGGGVTVAGDVSFIGPYPASSPPGEPVHLP